MIFEWDYNKARENEAKHGVSFEIAEHVFSSNMIAKEDTRQDYQEKRYTALRGDKIRIISMRKANERETKRYQEAIKNT